MPTRSQVARALTDSWPARMLDSAFSWAYYNNAVWQRTEWLGTRVMKLPLDLWMYQEMLNELRPDLIVETGTAHGGSALYLASICDLLDHGEIVTIDIVGNDARPTHPRIEYVTSSSIDPALVQDVRRRAEGKNVLVILDSAHDRQHVLEELRLYSPLVPVGGYVIVEDTNVNGHPVARKHGPGPKEAVDAFLTETDAFVIDREREKFRVTFNPGGYLRRVRKEGE